MHEPRLSLVVPFFNEADNIEPLLEWVHEGLAGYAGPWELICVSDGSTDDTLARLQKLAADYGDHLYIIDLQRNFGQTAAMQAGIDSARGELIATLDGDLQNDPRDITRMVRELMERDLDLLQGWRKNRKDGLWLRKIPSMLANSLIRRLSGVRLHDYGCSLKVYRAGILRQLRLYGEMHRLIPLWAANVTSVRRIGETVVAHHPRRFGRSKYSISRTFRVLMDLLAAFFFLRFRARPGHFFGQIGLVFGTAGSLLFLWLAADKFIYGNDIGGRPLLLVATLLTVASMQFITSGIIAEMLSRVLFETTNIRGYSVREPLLTEPGARGWAGPPAADETG